MSVNLPIKKFQPVIGMMCLCDWGVLFLGASNHQVKFVAKLVIKRVQHTTSFPLFLDLTQNQILKFLTKEKTKIYFPSSKQKKKKPKQEQSIAVSKKKATTNHTWKMYSLMGIGWVPQKTDNVKMKN